MDKIVTKVRAHKALGIEGIEIDRIELQGRTLTITLADEPKTPEQADMRDRPLGTGIGARAAGLGHGMW